MDAEHKDILDYLSQPNFEQIKTELSRWNIEYEMKNAGESVKAVRMGNKIYNKKTHTDEEHKRILYFYNMGIAYAPSGSAELIYAYTTRVNLLIHLNKFNEAIGSIDTILALTNSDRVKLELYCQKAICLAALSPFTKDDVFEEVDRYFMKVKLSVKNTDVLSDLIREIKENKSQAESMEQFKPNNQEFLQEKEQYNKIIIDREKVDPFDFVEIKLTENMGRGLFAKTNFKAGDLVLVEKPCMIGPSFHNQYVICSQCLSVAWTGIPCETCHDYIFCSLKCKTMAWKEYHYMECSITPYLILYHSNLPSWVHIGLKFVISLMKDYKTIDELKSKLNIPKNDQVKIENHKFEPKINLLYKLMSLSHNLSEQRKMNSTAYTVVALIIAGKYTTFFSEKFNDIRNYNFSKNEDFLFIASLLLRLVRMGSVNTHEIADNPAVLLPTRSSIVRGFCLGLISSHINHSCAPNIQRCFSDDMNYVFYTTEPIASGTQLLDSYNDLFYNTPLEVRKRDDSNFVCQCIACKEKWPCLILSKVAKAFIADKVKYDQTTYWKEISFMTKIDTLIQTFRYRQYLIDKDYIQMVADHINEVADILPQPSLVRCVLLKMFERIMDKYYGFTQPFENFCSSKIELVL
ncbi:SET and MYND domain-containing protein 4-like [Trichogramma pretiosum]|uniref:SET and MYND domain-containing protein 4-like n=1 Tax=Trichogramma pretiosum TaxID=7493 RepID=UPI0006C9B47C|nr:SET and MYND domain-containing protein 4-like [Trichogramma pretiosum]